MRKKILLPTDFSKNSWNAIQYAIKLYENQECDIYILNSYTVETFGRNSAFRLDPDEGLNKFSESRSNEGLGNILERLMIEYPNSNHNFFVVSRATTLLEAVEDLTNNLSIDLIVIGAKGISNEREGKYGRKTLEIIENVRKCPVLVIPKYTTMDHPKEIVMVTNFNTHFRISEVNHLAEIAKIGNARIQVLSMTENGLLSPAQKRNKMLLQKYFNDIDHKFNLFHNVKIADALNCFVEFNSSNLISYIDMKSSLWKQLGFGEPTLGKLGYYENVPVLALRE